MIKKYSLVLITFLCFVLSGFGQITEGFENGLPPAAGGYVATTSFTLSSGTWTGTTMQVIENNNLANVQSGTKSLQLRTQTGASIYSPIITTGGLGIVKFYSKSSGATGGLQVNYRINGGAWIPANGSPFSITSTMTQYTATVNDASPNIEFQFYRTLSTVYLDDVVTTTFGSTSVVDYCNLQSPAVGNTTVGTVYNIYARVYEAGVTNTAGADPSILGWIGYSTTNNDPSSPGWTWKPATWNTQFGNDDEYVANIGTLPTLASGTYYYASRFQISGGPYRYGGYNASGGGFWNATTNVNGVVSIDTPDFVNLQFPGIGTINLGNAFAVYGQVYEQGVTPGAGQGAGITAQIGYSSSNTDPNTWTNWIGATYNSGCTNTCNSLQNDEYSANLGGAITTAGTYYYATRFRLNGGVWLYGGILSDGSAGSFWDGTTHISGVLTVQAPNIDIERNTNASIANGAAANTGNNTVFATTVIGNSTAPKTYFIHNEGTANLVVTSLTSSNTTEFPVTLVPNTDFPTPSLPLTIAPGKMAEFEIVFSPNSILPSPTRNSTITVRSNDTFKDPYTFGVRGTADCVASALTINPISGPVGTIVTVQGTNFGASTSAKFNGTPVTVLTVLSSTFIEVTVPSGASTGSLEVTNQLGCKSSAFFTIINNLITSCQGTGTLPSALFISEVTDKGSGSHSYIEIYNGTGAIVDMSALNYQVRIHNNGATTATASINLTGTINNNTVTVVAIGGTDATSPEGGYTANFFSGTGGINDDDYIRLYRGTTWVDLWGETTGNAFTVTSKDYVYRRKNSGITVPSTTWNPSDWNAFTPVDYSNIGIYDYSVGIPPTVTVQPAAPLSSCDLTATLSVSATEGFSGGLPLSYQWYVSAPLPAATSWTAISNVGVYSGATTATLNISNTLNLDNFQYYCQVRENTATCFTASNAVRIKLPVSTWNGSVSTNWNTAANWTPVAVPNNTNIVVIPSGMPNSPILSGTPPLPPTGSPAVYAKSLVVLNGATITLQTGQNLVVQECIVNNGTIDLKNTANLVQVNETNQNSGNGNFYMERIVSNVQPLNYIYWSAPIAGFSLSGIPGSSNHKYYWSPTASNANGTQGNWINAGGLMSRGIGYIIRSSSSTANLNVILGGASLGTPHNGTFTAPLSKGSYVYTDPADNINNYWNLIGNPYPSAISADAFISQNAGELMDDNLSPTVIGTIYLWKHQAIPNASIDNPFYQDFVVNYDGSNYVSYNATGANPNGEFSGNIAAGQAFFVLMDETTVNNSVTFTNAMRYGDAVTDAYNNNEFLRMSSQSRDTFSNESIEKHRIWLDLIAPNNTAISTLVGYVQGATNGKDRLYDGYETSSNGLGLYSIVEDFHMGIQGRSLPFNDNDIVPLGANIPNMGTYTIAINQVDGLFEDGQSIFLEDTYTNIIHNMRSAPYTFLSEGGTFNNRFLLRYTNSTLSVQYINDVTDFSIIELPNGQVKFVVGNNLNIMSVEIIDMLGRSLYNLKGNNSSEVYELSNLSQSAYLAKVTLSNGQVITKRAVKRK